MNACDRVRTVTVREEVYEVPCGSRYCPACGQRWMGDMRVQAVAAIDGIGGDVGLITVTGPGDAYFAAVMRARGWSKKDAVRWWNANARRRWRRLYLRASSKARKENRAAGGDWRLLYRVWEYQKRGVLHLHVVVPMATPADRLCSETVLRRLVALGESEAFGYILGGDKDEEPGRGHVPNLVRVGAGQAARYVAKYVASTGAGKDNLVATVQRTAQRGSVLYISRTLTKLSGVTMTSLRARRRLWSRYPWSRKSEAGWKAACVVDAVQRGHAPLSREAVLAIRRAALRYRPSAVVLADTGEVRLPTVAARPLACRPNVVPRPTDGRRLVVGLASVLLPDSKAEHLGPHRSSVAVLEVAAA